MHWATFSASVSALIMTTGISRFSGSLLISLSTWSPLRSGIIRSSSTRLNFCFSSSDRLVSAGSAGDPLVTVAFEQQLQCVSIVLIVVDDEDTGHIRCHEHLELSSH